MKYFRFCRALFAFYAVLFVGIAYGAAVLTAKEAQSLDEKFISGVGKVKPAALDFLSLSVFNTFDEASKAIKSLEEALAMFRKDFGSQLNISGVPSMMPGSSAAIPSVGVGVKEDEEDNIVKPPAVVLGGSAALSALPSSANVTNPIQPPAAISSNLQAISTMPSAQVLPPITPIAPSVPGIAPLSNLPNIPSKPQTGALPPMAPVGGIPGVQDFSDEGLDFGLDDGFDGGFDLPPVGVQPTGAQPIGAPQLPPALAPIKPSINTFGAPATLPLPAPLPQSAPLNTPAPLPLPQLGVPLSSTLPPIAMADFMSDYPSMIRKSKKIKSLDSKMNKMMAVGSLIQEDSIRQAFASTPKEEQSEDFSLMSFDVDLLPKIATSDLPSDLEKSSVQLAELGDLE